MRTDLLALTAESVATLSNLGLVKRSLRDLEQGKGPELSEDADGTVVGLWKDGVRTVLKPGKTLKDTSCTCAAAGMCRHRVAVALGYRAWVAGQQGGEPPPSEAPDASWSPGDIADEALGVALPRASMTEALALRRKGLVVDIVRASASQPIPTAKLPSCTVRFLVPREIAYARCDCQVGQGCAHVALAVWSFRRADALDRTRASLTVEVSDGRTRARGEDELAAMVALVHDLAETGVNTAREALSQRFSLAAEALAKAGFTWPAMGLEDLSWLLERYRARSSRYQPSEALALATELVARARAVHAPSELPAAYVLGQGEAMETPLDHLRLVSLGARVESDGRERLAEVFLADPDTGAVMVLRKAWTFPEGESIPEGHELARRRVAGAGNLAQLATGQVVSRVARRRANRALVLGQSAMAQTSVMPQTGDFSALPRPLRVESLDELDASRSQRPPKMLRPRVLAESMHAVRIEAVSDCGFDASAQRLVAEATDRDARLLTITSPFLGASPHALDVLGQALSGAMGKVRWVAGHLSHEGAGWVLEPTMVVADRVVVPAVEERVAGGPIPAASPRAGSLAAHPLEAARSLLEEALQLGMRSVPPSYDARLAQAIRGLEEIGARGVSERMRAHAEVRARHRAGEDVSLGPSFFDASIRIALALEARSGVQLAPLAPSTN